MTSRSRKIEGAIVLSAFSALAAIWAINGRDDTWLYVTAAIIAIPPSWFISRNARKG